MSSEDSAGGSPRSWAAVGLAVLGVAVPAALTWAYAVDDAWIVARYARRIGSGLGYTFRDGPATDGITGPLGLLPHLAGELALADPMLGSRLVGVLAAALAAGWVVRTAARESLGQAVATAVWVAASPLVGIWAAAGLETGLATLAFTGLVLGAVRRSGWVVGLSVAALAWLRPEAAPAALVALVSLRGAGRVELVRAWGLALAGAASIVAFRLAMFGAPLPLSASAKPPDLAHGLGYASRAALLLFGGLGLVTIGWGARAPERRPAGWILLAHAAAVILAGGDWMPGFRLFVLAVPAAAWTAAGVVPRLGRLAGIGLFAGSLALPLAAGGMAVVEAREAARSRETTGRALAEWLEGHAERVALVDVGYLGFASGLDVVDLGGITDPTIARLPGGHASKRIDPGDLAARDPDALVLHSTVEPRVDAEGRLRGLAGHPVERRVAEMAWVRGRMRVVRVDAYAPGYWYVVLVPSPGSANGGTLEP